MLDHRPASVSRSIRSRLTFVIARASRSDSACAGGGRTKAGALRKSERCRIRVPKVVSRRQPQDLPADALTEVLRVPADKLPQFVGTEIGADFRSAGSAGYVIMKVSSSKPSDAIPAPQREAQARAITQQAAAAAEMTYAEGLKARHNVKILRADLQRKVEEKPAAKAPVTDVKPAAGK